MKLIKSFIIILILFSSCSYDKSILDTAISSAIVNQSNTTIPLEVRNRGIWLIGGSSSASTLSPISEVDLYDPVDNKWYEGITQLPKPVMFAGVTANNGKIYVIGGMTSAENLTRVVQIFDIESHTWSYGPDFPVAIQGLKAFSIETNVYTVGGSFTNDATGAISRIMKLNKLYNFWLALYDIAGVNTNYRIDAGVSTLENVMFFGGGRDSNGTYQNTNQLHYVSDYTATAAGTALPAQRVALSAASYYYQDKKYVFFTGGIFATGITSQPIISTLIQNTFYYYIPAYGATAQSMNTGQPMTKQRAYYTSVVWGHTLYVFGSLYNTTVWDDFEKLDNLNTANLATASWTSVGTMPRPRFGGEAVTLYKIFN